MSVSDWLHRLFIGDTSWLFLIEVIYRALVVYLFLLIAMRVMGKRVAGQLSIAELAVLLMLGAAISAPIQMPAQGILPALVVLGTIAAMQRGVAWWSYRSDRASHAFHGEPVVMVEDGRLVMEHLDRTKISREMLMSELRARGILELGELKRVYIEPAGTLSLFTYARPLPGLSLSPGEDAAVWPVCQCEHALACRNCGGAWHAPAATCRHCDGSEKVPACLPRDGSTGSSGSA